MGFQRGGGRGRGGGSYRGGRRGFANRGPKLPSALLDGIEQSQASASGHGSILGLARRKEQRKRERHEKKAARTAQQQSRAMKRHSSGAAAGADRPDLQRPVKRARLIDHPVSQQQKQQPYQRSSMQRHAAGAKGTDKMLPMRHKPNSKTRFEELLPGGARDLVAGGKAVNSQAAYLADLKAGRQAEKALGIKKGGSLRGPADGLGALLSGLSSATGDLLPSYLSSGAAQQAKGVLHSKDKKNDPTDNPQNLYDSDSEDEHGLGVLALGGDDDESDSEGGEDGMLGADLGSSDGEGPDDEISDLSDDDLDMQHGSDLQEAAIDEDDEDEEEEGEDDDMDGEDMLKSDDENDMLGSSEQEEDLSDEDVNDNEESDDELEDKEQQSKHPVHSSAASGTGIMSGRYVPPALRAAAAAAGNDGNNTALERRVTGLLNRLAEANLASIARDLVDLYGSHPRRSVVNAIISQLLQAAVKGPRATPAFAATAAALVAGVAGTANAAEMTASFVEGIAQQLEAAVQEKDSLSAQNLIQLLASCHAAGAVSSDLLYSLLSLLAQRFTEDDIQLTVTLLGARGLALRASDPASMKDFVLQVSNKVAEVNKAAGAGTGSNPAASGLSTRARLMLELVIDIKNNRPGKAAGGGKKEVTRADGRVAGASAAMSTGVQAWLKGCHVDRVAVRGISWAKLLIPNKKGMWWMPEAGEALLGTAGGGGGGGSVLPGAGNTLLAAATGGGPEGAAEAAKLLQLAAAQRMNTDARRAVFVAVMGAADVVHAHERLLRLPLKGEQQREVVRVVVDCCLHEAAYNPFYALLIARLAQHSKAHRLTAQFCMWDQYKVISELQPGPLAHLARMNATLITKDVLQLTSLKVVDFASVIEARSLFFWRLFFQHLLAACTTVEQVRQMFERVALGAKPSSKTSSDSGEVGGAVAALRAGMQLFLRMHVGPWLAEKDGSTKIGKTSIDEVLIRLRIAEVSLRSVGRR